MCSFQVGNPSATVIALCALRDVSIEQESNQLAILELGGIGILLNILKTDNWPCVVRFFCSGTPSDGHLVSTVTSSSRPCSSVLAKYLYSFFQEKSVTAATTLITATF